MIKIVASRNKINYNNQFNKDTYKGYHIRLHKTNDKDLIAHIDKQTNKNNYFKILVELDMLKEKSE